MFILTFYTFTTLTLWASRIPFFATWFLLFFSTLSNFNAIKSSPRLVMFIITFFTYYQVISALSTTFFSFLTICFWCFFTWNKFSGFTIIISKFQLLFNVTLFTISTSEIIITQYTVINSWETSFFWETCLFLKWPCMKCN